MPKKKDSLVIEEYDYIDFASVVENVEEVVEDFEVWMNTNLDYIITWERLFNVDDFEIDVEDFLSIDEFIENGVKCIKKTDGVYFVHPHVFMAYTWDDPIVKIGMINAIMGLNEDTISSLISQVYRTE